MILSSVRGSYIIEKQKIKAIEKPFATSLVVFEKHAVNAMTIDISIVIIIPVIQRVFFLPHLSTKYKHMTFAIGPTIPYILARSVIL